MALPAEQLAEAHGLKQPLRITEGITNGEMASILEDAGKNAEVLMQKNLLRAGVGAKMSAAQMKAAMSGMGQLSADMWKEIAASTRSGIYASASLAADQAMDRMFLVGMPFKAIQMYEEEFYFNAFQGAEDIISRRTNGFTLSERIYRNGQIGTMQAGRIVEQGLALQQSARQIAGRVRGLYDPSVPGGQSYAAMRLGRTEINNAHHDTTIRLSEKQPWVLAYKWNLSGSHPKTDICNDLADRDNGMGPGVYPKGDAPDKPHPQCLCYLSIVQEDPKDFTKKLIDGNYDGHLSEMGVHC